MDTPLGGHHSSHNSPLVSGRVRTRTGSFDLPQNMPAAISGSWVAHIPLKQSSEELKCRVFASADLSSNPSTYSVYH